MDCGELGTKAPHMNEKPIAIIIVGLGFAGFLYTLLNPAAAKAANEHPCYRRMGFGSKPIEFWRFVGLAGTILAGAELLYILFGKSL